MVLPFLALVLLSVQAPVSPPALTPDSVAVVQEPGKPKPPPPKPTPKPPPRAQSTAGGAHPTPRPRASTGQPRGTGEPKLKRRGN